MSAAPTKRRDGRKTAETLVAHKDDTELRLEKALFGDDAGFFNALQYNGADTETALVYRGEDRDLEGLENEDDNDDNVSDLADDQLFFLDAGADVPSNGLVEDVETAHSDEHPKRRAAWYDSDDDRITVSLATHTRLRKLRHTEDDDVVTGAKYIQRLREQYERLHPTPEWVRYARKKRRLSNGDAEHNGHESDSSGIDEDEDTSASVRPLGELLRSAGSLVKSTDGKDSGRKRKLRPEVLDIQRTKDVVKSGPSSVDVLQFHPYYPLLLSAGPSSTINLYHISPQPPHPNPLLTSLHLKRTPLRAAGFCVPSKQPPSNNETDPSADQTRIFLSSRRRYFHTWSLSSGTVSKTTRVLFGQNRRDQKSMEQFKLSPCGRYMGLIGSGKKGGGSINVISTTTMQWICSCRIDSQGGVADFAWWTNGEGFAAVGKNGEVSEYDISEKAVVCRWIDEGSVGTTVIALGGSDLSNSQSGGFKSTRWTAIGSSSGIVNVYDRRKFADFHDGPTTKTLSSTTMTYRPKPEKVFDQLTTPISHLEFSSDAQMLVLSSRWKKDGLKLVHLPSCTVFRNWPTAQTPLGRIASVALSKDGRYLAVGNEQGRIRLWEIRG